MKPFIFTACVFAIAPFFTPTALAQPPESASKYFGSSLAATDLDEQGFSVWEGRQTKPVANINDGPAHVAWTQTSAPQWDGLNFGDSKTPGARHLRLGFKRAIPAGSVLTRAGGRLSVLKAGAAYPGNLSDETQWIAAQRLKGGKLTSEEVERDDYALWVLPPGTQTRALRFTHVAAATDQSYNGWLGGVAILPSRLGNLAPQASISAAARDEIAARLADDSSNGWAYWDNGSEGNAKVLSGDNAESIVLSWPQNVRLRGLAGLNGGFGGATVQIYNGPATRHPRQAQPSDWKTIARWEDLQSQYPRNLGIDWLDFQQTISTRGVRLLLDKSINEGHPHLNGATKNGRRVWLAELMALSPLDALPLSSALLPVAKRVDDHAPIPIRFTLPAAGLVSLIIEDASGKRVRNLVSETPFPKGANVAWWDGTDDLGRDPEAARHGVYRIPARPVAPGRYRVRGLWRGNIDLRYEFSVYNAGTPAWETEDKSGGWLTNHTPPSSALSVPASQSPGGKPLVYLGSFVSEGGAGLAWADLEGRKQGGRGWIGGNWTAAPYLARDDGANRIGEIFAYVGAPWSANDSKTEGEIRLTGLSKDGDRPILKWNFTLPKASGGDADWGAQMGGLAARDGVVAFSLPKLNQIGFVDAAFRRLRGVASIDNPRGVAFDTSGRLLVLSGNRLLRFDLPPALKPAQKLSSIGWSATAGAHSEDAAKAIDADPRSRWSTNGGQEPGQNFTLDLKTKQSFSTIVLRSDSERDSPRHYEVAVSDDGQKWSAPIVSSDGPPANDPARGVTMISFAPQNTRFVRISQTGRDGEAYWSINDLELYNRPAPATGQTLELGAPKVLYGDLDEPQGIAVGPEGAIYVSQWGRSHNVKVLSEAGASLRSVGKAGIPQAGPYDEQRMNRPKGLSVDENGRLWVAEEDYQPKRVSLWNADGTLRRAMYGPSRYGGGGRLDNRDKNRFYYDGMEFQLDWKSGANRPIRIFHRLQEGELSVPDGYGSNGPPEAPLYFHGAQYLTNCFNSNPTNGSGIAMMWQLRDNIARPVAAMGRANDWSLLKSALFAAKWPPGTKPNGDYGGDGGANRVAFVWSDANDDNQMQPDEVEFTPADSGGVTVMPDGAFVLARWNTDRKDYDIGSKTRAMRFAPVGFSPKGAPKYSWTAGKVLSRGAQSPTTSGGDQALAGSEGWAVLTVAPQPFAPQSLGGAQNGVPKWSYPSLWPGLHASHESPPPDRPGMVIGTTRLLGGFITPKLGDGGPLWMINGNQGNIYCFTQDGLFVATLFKDVRQGGSFSMPLAQRNMKLNDQSLHDENFWPSVTQTPDGKIYLVEGGRTSLVRVDGLESIRRIAPTDLTVSAADLKAAAQWQMREEVRRQKEAGQTTLKVLLRADTPTIDGKLDDWSGAQWASIDKSGTAAYFDSNTKPYDVQGAVAIAGGKLFAAWKTGDENLLRNSGEIANAPFKTGGALDLMIGANSKADPNRSAPAEGDMRLLITRVSDKTRAVLYRAVVAGTTTPVPFSSPSRTIKLDRVEDISDKVLWSGAGGNFEISVPLETLGLKPQNATSIKGDIGILRGNGVQTIQRVYWSNKATAIVSDVPSEAELTPRVWGQWDFVAP